LANRLRQRRLKVSVVIPARDEARTIGDIVGRIASELGERIVSELVVVDCDSSDRTAEIAEVAGARVERLPQILPDVPWVLGKGEALWRSLAVVEGDIVCFVDGDIRNFDGRFVSRLLAPLIADETLAFTKGFYRRPLRVETTLVPAAGGRVTELTARPLLNLLYPELAGFLQPLAGEYAGRREVLERLPFRTGYGVDVALLIDLLGQVGLDAMAQVDLDERVHRNRPLRQLRGMATTIVRAIAERADRDGRIKLGSIPTTALLPDASAGLEITDLSEQDRPPMREVLAHRERRDA
jgi:glucosyl-3-phosphoglycerate synthase